MTLTGAYHKGKSAKLGLSIVMQMNILRVQGILKKDTNRENSTAIKMRI